MAVCGDEGGDGGLHPGVDVLGGGSTHAEGHAKLLVTDDAAEELLGGDLRVRHLDLASGLLGGDEVRLIGVNWPGGFHHLYAELADAFAGDGPPDFGPMGAAAARHGAEILGPPLAVLDAAPPE